MAEGYLNRWLLVSAPQEAEMHLPGQTEPMDVVWLSGSAIAVAARTSTHFLEQQLESHPEESIANQDESNYYDISNDSDTTIEYQSSETAEPRTVTVTESEDGNAEYDSELEQEAVPNESNVGRNHESDPELEPEAVTDDSNVDGNAEYDSELEPEVVPHESNVEINHESDSELEPEGGTDDSNVDGNQEYDSEIEPEPVTDESNVDGNQEYDSELETEPITDDSNTDGNMGNGPEVAPVSDVPNIVPEEESEVEQVMIAPNMDGNSILIIEHESTGEQLAQEPNVVTVPENPIDGVENPIIRLENPDYEPESCKSTSSESTRGSNKRSYGAMMSEEEDDGQTCPVCFDVWTNAGDHRLSALKCGHLFGKSCIIRWLSKEKKKYCPQCNKKAHPNDVRELYATKLTALDSTERNRLEKEVQIVKDEKKKLEMELMRCNLNVEMYKEQLEALKLKVSKLTGDINSKNSIGKTESKHINRIIKFYLEKTYEINEGCCRVCAYDSLTNVLVVSHQTRNQLFPGYGIKKIQKVGSDYFGNNFLYLHSKALRDLSFHPVTPNLILTVSFDRCAKLADLKQHSVLHTFKADYPLWSCCWDVDDPNYFYAGAGNGCVHVFDVRSPSVCAIYLNPTDDSSAVVSVRYASSKPPFKGGIICCRLNSLTVYEKIGPGEYNAIPLHSLVGPFFSLSYDPFTQHILASCRPSEDSSKVRHVYCEFNGTDCRKVHTFCGGTRQTLLSRSCFIRINNETLVAVFQENTNAIELWSTSTGAKVQSIPVTDQILDFTAIQIESRYLLGTVSDSLVRFYETSSYKS